MELNKNFSNRRYLIVASFSIFFFYLVTSCSEEPLKVGINLLPKDELLEVFDTTIYVQLYTVSAEPLKSPSFLYSALGSVYDPVMGSYKADYLADLIYTQLVSFYNTISDDVTVHSLELVLSYDYVYGDSMEIDFEVYELIDTIPKDQSSDFVVTPEMINPVPINIGPPEILNDTILRAFKVMLSVDDYANKFIDPQLIADSAYQPNHYARFKDAFKGLYISTKTRTTEGGGMVRIDHNASRMILNTIEWNTDSLRYDTISNLFSMGNPASLVDSGGVNLNMSQSIFSDDILAALNDTINSQSLVYLHSLTGPNVYVELPNLDFLRDQFGKNIAINKAELTLPINQELYSSEIYKSPGFLGLIDRVSNTYLADDGLVLNYFGGKLDVVNFQYKFNVGNHLHNYIQRDVDTLYSNKYLLFPSHATIPVSIIETYPARVVLNGGNSEKVPELKIIYSIIPE